MKEFAERLKRVQNQKGITQKELAQMLGISPGSLSSYMRDAKTPALDVACDIAKKLNVPIGWLCGEPEETVKMVTYADLLRTLVKLVDSAHAGFIARNDTAAFDEHGFFSDPDPDMESLIQQTYVHECAVEGTDPTKVCYASLETIDQQVLNFWYDWRKVRDLHIQETIDDEMYEAWLEKRFRDYENSPLPGMAVQKPEES